MGVCIAIHALMGEAEGHRVMISCFLLQTHQRTLPLAYTPTHAPSCLHTSRGVRRANLESMPSFIPNEKRRMSVEHRIYSLLSMRMNRTEPMSGRSIENRKPRRRSVSCCLNPSRCQPAALGHASLRQLRVGRTIEDEQPLALGLFVWQARRRSRTAGECGNQVLPPLSCACRWKTSIAMLVMN